MVFSGLIRALIGCMYRVKLFLMVGKELNISSLQVSKIENLSPIYAYMYMYM